MQSDNGPAHNHEGGALDSDRIESLEAPRQLSHLGDHSEDSLLHVPVYTGYAQVSMPLDKVYGVLGLCRSRIAADYLREMIALCNEVAMEVADNAFFNERSEMVSLLCSGDHEPTSGLASWAVELTRARSTTPLGIPAIRASLYRAGGTTALSVNVDRRLDAEFATLYVPGILFHTVQQLSVVFSSTNLSAEACPTRNNSLRQAIDFMNAQNANHFLPHTFPSFCETIVAGTNGFEKVRYPQEFVKP